METKRLYALFAIFSFLALVVLSIAAAKNHFPDWKQYQKEFNRRAEEKAKENILVKEVEPGIRQIWNPDLGVTDRCITCHLGIEETSLNDALQPFTSHPTTPHGFQEFGCTICHGGQGLATTRAAHGRGEIWEKPMLPGIFAQASCGLCHEGVKVPEAYVLNQGRALIEKAGCVGCHKMPGFSRPEMIGPDLTGVGSKVRPSWLYKWLKRPKDYLARTLMPDPLLSDEEARILTTFLVSHKDEKIESTAEGQQAETANESEIARGKTIYRQARCTSCHAQEGRGGIIGPELTRVSSKVNGRWLLAWLKNPKQYLPRTRMPQFSFPEKDIEAVSAYIESEFVDYESDPQEDVKIEELLPEPNEPTMRQGEQLFKKHGCAGCHTISGIEAKGGIGPELYGIGNKDVDRLDFGDTHIERDLWSWLTMKVKEPRAFAKNLKMPEYEFTNDQVRAIVVALLSMSDRQIPSRYLPPPARVSFYAPQGEFGAVVTKYNCLTCHKMNGQGGDLAPDLSIEASKARPEWIAQYFKLPYSLRPIMEERMPLLNMTDEEIKTTVEYFERVLVSDAIPKELPYKLGDSQLVEQGRKFYFEKYSCRACHQINLEGGYVGPALDGVGNRLYAGYIYNWLKNPQAFLPTTIDPNRGLSDEEAAAITAFLMKLPPAKGERLAER
jgi:cytochrome c2